MTAPWTDERIETLRRMWANGQPADYIAFKLDGGITRNAVIGKARRLRLGEHPNRCNRAVRGAGKPVMRRYDPKARGAPPKPVPAAPAPPVAAVEPCEPITFMQLRDGVTRNDGTFVPGTCKWPLGESPPFEFCGAHTVQAASYCSKHQRVGTVPVPARQKIFASRR